jgi:hypothetical protein
MLKSISNLIEHDREALLESLRGFLKMKSIAAQNLGMQETAEFLVSAMGGYRARRTDADA